MNNKTITIMAPNIKAGGGLELLLYLVEHVRKQHKQIKFDIYVDESIKNIKSVDNISVIHIGGSLNKIKLFSKEMENTLYFGNLPPLVKSTNSIVYFHNLYLLLSLDKLRKTSVKFFMKYSLQQLYIKLFVKNVDFVACQNNEVKDKFIEKYNYKKVELLPFFRLCDRELLKKYNKIYDFCYVSLVYPHKNHSELLDACEILSKENIPFSLVLTISDNHKNLLDKIENINKNGIVSIVNLGVIPKEYVGVLYAQSKCLVFPSSQETFGLGLIEAVNMDLDVISADLDYVYQSVEPSLVFDPKNSADIALKMKYYLQEEVKKSYSKIDNKIDDLIALVSHKN